MSFPATVFRVLIASPSDVSAERDIAVRTIQEWNDLNSAERQLALLPLRWESHSAPEFGKRPQEVINRQVVDHCDLLVGIFWTRIGSPTGIADGGTVEEIERVASQGKPVMLYFSRVKEEPDKLDLDQMSKLRAFKAKTFPNALVESYGDHVEFKEKLSKQIEIQLRSLLAAEGQKAGAVGGLAPVADIVLHFANPSTGADAGTELAVERNFLDLTRAEEIPDYSSPPAAPAAAAPGTLGALLSYNAQPFKFSQDNPNYYRQKAAAFIRGGFFTPIAFWLKNRGGLGARDVYVSVTMRATDDTPLFVIPMTQLTASPPSKTSFYTVLSDAGDPLPKLLSESGPVWTSSFDIGALQPQRELTPPPEFAVGAKRDCEILIATRIFADVLPEPRVEQLRLKLTVRTLPITGSVLYAAISKND